MSKKVKKKLEDIDFELEKITFNTGIICVSLFLIVITLLFIATKV